MCFLGFLFSGTVRSCLFFVECCIASVCLVFRIYVLDIFVENSSFVELKRVKSGFCLCRYQYYLKWRIENFLGFYCNMFYNFAIDISKNIQYFNTSI